MASVTDDSIASVPFSEMARIREQLLQEPEVGNVARMSLSGAATSVSDNSKDVSGEIAASIPESVNAYQTPHPSLKAPPRISTSKSASAAEMEVTVDPSPSQEAFKALTRASSFHGYPGGDTQPMESQVYKDFRESIIKSATTTPKKAGKQISTNGGNNTYDTLVTEGTPKTCVEGDTGYIDLANAMPSPNAQWVSPSIHDFPTSPETQLRTEEDKEIEYAMPKTPAARGHKRKWSDENLTSAVTERQQPAFSQLFGGGQNAPMYSTTQLFNQTQAPSSPVPDGPRSDPVITRPSPNLQHQFSTSPPPMAMSSPVANVRPSTAVEPRGHYTSMQESQDRRLARFRTELGRERDIDDDILEDDDEEDDAQQRQFENKRKQRAKSEQAEKEFVNIRAPSRPGSRATSGPKDVIIDIRTPAVEKTRDDYEFDVSEDGDDGDDDNVMEVEQAGEADPDNDVYDELGQTVLRSQGFGQGEEVDVSVRAHEICPTSKDEASAELKYRTHDNDMQREDQDDIEEVEHGPVTQHFAIADSQPMRLEQSHSQLSHQMKETPSISSFVPGSQYAGRNDQDQAQLSKQSGTPNLAAFFSNCQFSENALSSSPLPVASSAVQVIPDPKIDEDVDIAGEQIVPESDLPGVDADLSNSSRSLTRSNNTSGDSNKLNVFCTAATHLSGSQHSREKSIVKASPQKFLHSQQSNMASQSPRAAAGVRRFADLARPQSLSRGESRETDVDLDAFMKDVITADDQQYIDAVSSPPQERPQKRRRLGRMTSSDSKSSSRNTSASEFVQQESLRAEENEADAGVGESDVHVEEVDENPRQQSTTALQESPSKANEMPSATQESVREREKAGAKVVSQLLSTRSAKPLRSTAPHSDKPERNSKAKRAGKTTGNKLQIAAPAKSTTDGADDGLRDVNQSPMDEARTAEIEALAITAPNRVFALFKGRFNKFYPATWLSSSANGLTYLVKFDDADPISIETQHVRRLELRVGDQVKVDMPGMTNKTWLAKSIDPVAVTDEERAAGTDIYGRAMLQVQAKASRNNLPGDSNTGVNEDGRIVNIAISSVYLTHSLWTRYSDRTFTPPAGSTVVSKAMTPSSSAGTRDSETPVSKSRRNVIPTAKVVNGRTSHLRDESVSSATTPTGLGLFSGMIFALSYGPNANEKEEVARLIRRNGGNIVESGFDELFKLPDLEACTTSNPTKKSPNKQRELQDNEPGLQLKDEYRSAGFVALLTDRHSRKAKYVQALALGLPTLSGRWITDSLDVAKNSTLATGDVVPLQWSKYLLPAGESTYLNGAVRSRTMEIYAAKDAKLAQTIANRNFLLDGDGVLIVASKKGKANLERSETYAFLTLALGASRVKRMSDLLEAKTLISEEPAIWQWIYVDGSVDEANAALFGKAAGGGKKRKRGDDVLKTDVNKMSAGDGNVKIVNDEFVVQSLILGALVD